MKYMMTVCGLVLSSLASHAVAAELPQRKAGLWEHTMTTAQMGGHKMTMQQCTDAKTDKAMMKKAMSGGNDGNGDCQQSNIKRTKTGFEVDTVCKQENGTLTSHIVVTGDFKRQYKMVVTGRMSPPQAGMSKFSSQVVARHVGACPANMKAGDMKVNGMLMNANGLPSSNMSNKISPQQIEAMQKMMEEMKKHQN